MAHGVLRAYIAAYKNKLTNKLSGVVRVPHKSQRRGAVLLSYLTLPFTRAPHERFTDPHSNYWVPPEIARLFSERGYDVDIIDWDNDTFTPSKSYAAYVDLGHNLARLAPLLGPSCTKVLYTATSHPDFQNKAEHERLENLRQRRGIQLNVQRTVPQNLDLSAVDIIAGYGNKTVHNTFSDFHGPIVPLPIPTMDAYDFPDKDFARARTHFLWFGGGGAVLKGLDLVLEAFAELPHLELSVMGPAVFEKDFAEAYAAELQRPNITVYERPKVQANGDIYSSGRNIRDIMNDCAAIVSLSASEGGSGATVHAMQAGLIPIVTPQNGINERAPQIVIENPTVEKVREVVTEFSQRAPAEIEKMARATWAFAHEHHTKEAFTRAFEHFIDADLNL